LLTAYILRVLKIERCPEAALFRSALACAVRHLGLAVGDFRLGRAFLAACMPELCAGFFVAPGEVSPGSLVRLSEQPPPVAIPLWCVDARFLCARLWRFRYRRWQTIPALYADAPDWVAADPAFPSFHVAAVACFVAGDPIEFPILLGAHSRRPRSAFSRSPWTRRF
jgi:hypothetical protein